MGAQVIIDTRRREVRASLDAPGEGTTIFAVDLIRDTWDDFLYFVDQAHGFEHSGDWTKRNRYVRVATASLFSHLDGLVSEAFDLLRAELSFKSYLPKNPKFCSLKAKIIAVQEFLHDTRGLSPPKLNIELKLLRDIINHPSISKIGNQDSGDAVLLNGTDVYGIAVDDLAAAGHEVDNWLNVLCASVSFSRFTDTKRIIEEYTRALGANSNSIRDF